MLRETRAPCSFLHESQKDAVENLTDFPADRYAQIRRHKGPSAARCCEEVHHGQKKGANDRKVQVTVATSPDAFSEIVDLQGFDLV